MFRLLAEYANSVEWFLQEIGQYEFLPSSWLLHTLARNVCNKYKTKSYHFLSNFLNVQVKFAKSERRYLLLLRDL